MSNNQNNKSSTINIQSMAISPASLIKPQNLGTQTAQKPANQRVLLPSSQQANTNKPNNWVGDLKAYRAAGASIQSAAQNANTSKKCIYCRDQGFYILPLKYAAVRKTSSAPELPETIGKSVKNHVLTHSKYSLQIINDGFVYILAQGKKGFSWFGYRPNAEGQFARFDVGAPIIDPPKFSCTNESHSGMSAMLSIPATIEPKKAFILFSYCPLTKDKLKEIEAKRQDLVSIEVLQLIDIEKWKAGQNNQLHCMTEAQVKNKVHKNTAYNEKRWGKMIGNLKLWPKGAAAIALNDPIGITKALNEHRNDQFKSIITFLAEKDSKNPEITNEYKLNSLSLVETLEKGIKNKVITQLTDQNNKRLEQRKFQKEFEEKMGGSLNRSAPEAAAYKWLQKELKNNPTESLKRTYSELELLNQKRQQQYDQQQQLKFEQKLLKEPEDAWKEYAELLDMDAVKTFKTKAENVTKNSLLSADKYVNDHVKWVKSDLLIDHLFLFDQGDSKEAKSNGFIFYEQIMECVKGMGACKVSEEVLQSWLISKKIDERNIFLRAMLYNNKKAIQEYDSVIPTITEKILSFNSEQSAFKTFMATVAALDTAYQTWAANPVNKSMIPNFDKNFIGRASRWTSEYTRAALRVLNANPVDRTIVACIAFMLYCRIGEITSKVQLSAFMSKRYREEAGKISAILTEDAKKASEAVKTVTDNKNHLGATRIAGAVMALEFINLAFQMNTAGPTQKMNLAIAATGLASASLEVAGGIAGAIGKAGSEIVLKFSAAAFASSCSVILAILDFESFRKSENKFLSIIYISRSGAFTLLSLGYLIISINYLTEILRRNQSSLIVRLLPIASVISQRLAIIIISVGTLNIIILGLTMTELIYNYVVKDNELKEWCKKSLFSKSGNVYKNIAKETEDFFYALEEVI